MKPTVGALTQVTTLVALLKVIHDVSITPDGTAVTFMEYKISLVIHHYEFSKNKARVNDADGSPSRYI
jgi:hypothetical protein